MITFACKKIKQEELVRCSFELNKTEYNVFIFLLKKNQLFTVSRIAELMGLERTTVQKAIKQLIEKELVKRRQKNLPNGSYTFLYQIKNKDEIKNKMKKIVYEWYNSVETAISRM